MESVESSLNSSIKELEDSVYFLSKKTNRFNRKSQAKV